MEIIEINEHKKVDLNLDTDRFYEKYKRKKTVSAFTLGCKVNQYETEVMMEKFIEKGYQLVGNHEYADIYIINTCTVTNLSDRKSRQFIRKAKKTNPNAIIGVVGCYVQVSADEIAKISEIDVIAGTKEKYDIVNLCEKFEKDNIRINEVSNIMENKKFDEMEITHTEGRTRAYIKIQEGCNNFCSYCIIPYARGPIRSRDINNILNEVKRLVKEGYKEVVLTGIHVASYGKDLGKLRLIDVIETISKVNGLDRIRLSSLEPTHVDEEFMNRIIKIKSFCPHFHLSLQSGSDTVLKRMNRKYTTKMYDDAVIRIRRHYPTAAITTDIIVGFPGETEEEYNETLDFVKKIKFSNVHVFRYSPRAGTPAAQRTDQVDGIIKNARSKNLIKIVEHFATEFNDQFIGKEVEVLFENGDELDMIGHTKNYLKVEINEFVEEGKTYNVIIEKNNKNLLFGVLKS